MIDALSEALSLSAAIFSHADESVEGSQEDDTVPWAFFCILLCFHHRFGTCMPDPIYCMFASGARMQLPALTLLSLKTAAGPRQSLTVFYWWCGTVQDTRSASLANGQKDDKPLSPLCTVFMPSAPTSPTCSFDFKVTPILQIFMAPSSGGFDSCLGDAAAYGAGS